MKNESINEVRPDTESYECQLSNAPSNIENDPKLDKNVGVKLTTPATTMPHATLSRTSQKLSGSTSCKQILKAMIISFQTHSRILRTTQKWARMNLDNLPLFPGKSYYSIFAITPSILNQKLWFLAHSKALREGNIHVYHEDPKTS